MTRLVGSLMCERVVLMTTFFDTFLFFNVNFDRYIENKFQCIQVIKIIFDLCSIRSISISRIKIRFAYNFSTKILIFVIYK